MVLTVRIHATLSSKQPQKENKKKEGKGRKLTGRSLVATQKRPRRAYRRGRLGRNRLQITNKSHRLIQRASILSVRPNFYFIFTLGKGKDMTNVIKGSFPFDLDDITSIYRL